MSADPNEDPAAAPPSEPTATTTPEASPDDSGVLPVEVEAPDPVATLEAKVATLEKEKKENWDRYLRAAADLENLRKRQKREAEDAKFDAKQRVLKEMLPVVDNLERAIEHAAAGGDGDKPHPIVEGVQLVLRQFTTAFERLDVTAIDALNQPFDPNLHEAISQQESDQPAGTVVQVLQRGYKAGDRLLRPSLVVVASSKTSGKAEPAAE